MKRILISLSVVLVILAILFGISDRVAAQMAEQEIADRVSTHLASRNITSAPPEVTITGFPFLTQVARGNYAEVQLNLRDLKGGTIPLPLLEVRAYDVRATVSGMRSGERAVATRVTGLGTLSYADLVAASGLTGITLVGDGSNLRVTGVNPIAGEVRGSAKVSVVEGKVRLQIIELTAANLTPEAQQMVSSYAQKLARTFSLPPLPFNLRLDSVEPAPSGLRVGVSANEVNL